MSVFGDLASYYDLLYADKNYREEAAYVEGLFQRFGIQGKRLLSLGCGTGAHDLEMVRNGYQTTGVDVSANMLELAHQKHAALELEEHKKMSFHQGDMRTWRNEQQFDGIMSLFHVVSYQTSQSDLEQSFTTFRQHLVPGGIAVFDCWYGPAVLTDRPGNREKTWENDLLKVHRSTRAEMVFDENTVEVHFDIDITDKKQQTSQQLQELHRMRYLFLPELKLLTQQANLELLHHEQWMTGAPLNDSTWYATLVCRAI
ncbi:MAG: class I SAM-dependent DNA methyltransferase [Salibacteraceae bacterium]